MGCDGVFTAAASLRGPTELCMDLLADPDYARELLEFVHTALCARMKAWRDYGNVPVPQDGFGSADDSVELLSLDQYREFMLPLHKRLFDQFGTPGNRGIHLCGDAQRHFVTLRDELGVTSFDTGFPVDFAKLRRDLGPGVLISGGPPVTFFLEETSQPILAKTGSILSSGILEGGRFILQEANNLPPGTRLEICHDFYEFGKKTQLRN